MKTVCGCGKPMGDFGGVLGVAYLECKVCTDNGGDYRKSDYWNHALDKREEKNLKSAQVHNDAMADVVPLKEKGKKSSRGGTNGTKRAAGARR